jgi:hypothetical protein
MGRAVMLARPNGSGVIIDIIGAAAINPGHRV